MYGSDNYVLLARLCALRFRMNNPGWNLEQYYIFTLIANKI
jgi:hypothetical protein